VFRKEVGMIPCRNKYNLIRVPVITEKSTSLSKINQYVFMVHLKANKSSIKKVIEQIFSVNVKSINILNYKGKVKRFKGIIGHRSNVKKAIVCLDKNDKIDLSGGGKIWV